jgi:hypothetical protein
VLRYTLNMSIAYFPCSLLCGHERTWREDGAELGHRSSNSTAELLAGHGACLDE